MQTPKTSGSLDGRQRTSPTTPRSNRLIKAARMEPDSAISTNQVMKNQTDRSPKVIRRRSPRSPMPEKQQENRVTELECQLTQLHEDLRRTKGQLSSSESLKRQAQQEAEEAKKQLAVISARYEGFQRQQVEVTASEEARIQELCKLSKERDRAWQSELSAVQNQRSFDSVALNSAVNEIQRLKKQSEMAHAKLQALKQDMAETLSTVEKLKIQLRDSEQAKAQAQSVVNDTEHRLEIAKTTIETLRSDEVKLKESLMSMAAELKESRACISLQLTDSLELEVEQLRSTLEAAELKFQEEQTRNIVHMQSAYESIERFTSESSSRVTDLESTLKDTKTEVVELKAKLFDKEMQLRGISDVNERLHSEIRGQVQQIECNLSSKLTQSTAEIANLKAKLKGREAELRGISEENELLKSEIEKRGLKLEFQTEEADKSSKMTVKLEEDLDAANAANSEMEAELRRLRVQSDQWRKAAEAAAAVLTAGKDGGLMERSFSVKSEYNTIGGKLLNSPFSDDSDEEPPGKMNGNMLRRIGGLWKKGQK